MQCWKGSSCPCDCMPQGTTPRGLVYRDIAPRSVTPLACTHLSSIGLSSPKRIIATGGASGNGTITQIIADVFDAPVFASTQTDSASLGAALRALHGHVCHRHSPSKATPTASSDEAKTSDGATGGSDPLAVTFDSLVGATLAKSLRQVAAPNAEATAEYTRCLEAYRAAEHTLVARFADTPASSL